MGFSAFYASSRREEGKEENATKVIHAAVKAGATLLNSATFYGPMTAEGFGENLRLLKSCIKDLPRSDYQLMVKVGMDTRGGGFAMKSDAEYLTADVDYALETLGVDFIDTIVLCRVPKDRPVEEAVANMKALVDAGKAKNIGLSEANAATIRRAHAVTPIHCIEQEWSLWSRDIEAEIVPACRELGIKIVAYSPLGRGFLTGTIKSRDEEGGALDGKDFRKFACPQFAEENFDHNKALLEKVEEIAAKVGCTVGQLSLAWLHAQGDDVIPIPGTTNVSHFEQNYAALGIKLTPEQLQEIDDVKGWQGLRYPGNHNTFHEN